MLERNSGGQIANAIILRCPSAQIQKPVIVAGCFIIHTGKEHRHRHISNSRLLSTRFLWLAKHFSPTHSDSSVHTINCYTSFHIQYFSALAESTQILQLTSNSPSSSLLTVKDQFLWLFWNRETHAAPSWLETVLAPAAMVPHGAHPIKKTWSTSWRKYPNLIGPHLQG